MKSPITGNEMTEKDEIATVQWREEDVTFMKRFYQCPDTGQKFTSTEQDTENIKEIVKQYNLKIS